MARASLRRDGRGGIGVAPHRVRAPPPPEPIHWDPNRQHAGRIVPRAISALDPDPGDSPGGGILGPPAQRHALVGQSTAGAVDHLPDAGLVAVERANGAGPFDKTRRSSAGGTLTEVLASLIIWILGILTLLQMVFDVDIRAILAALGVGGLAVALALQDTLSNLFAGFYVSVARQIRIGDFVKIDAGQSGYVQDIGWRSTTLRDLGGSLIFIPNNKLAQSIVTNYNLPATADRIRDHRSRNIRLRSEPGGTAAERSRFRRRRASSRFVEGSCAVREIYSRFREDIYGLHFGLPCGRVRRSISRTARASQADLSPLSR